MSFSPESASVSLTLVNDLSELERMACAVRRFAHEHGLPQALRRELQLILEEVVANVVTHGYPGGGRHEIHVELRVIGCRVMLRIEDDAAEFNPLQVPLPDTACELNERPVGGLGILLVRKLADKIEYRREAGRNILLIEKRVHGGQEPRGGRD